MTTPKPVYSRPSDDEPTPAPKRKRRRKRVHTTDTLAAAPVKEIANLDTIEVHHTAQMNHTVTMGSRAVMPYQHA